MTRPVIALRQWINLRQSLSPTAGALLNAHVDFLAPSAHPLALTKRTPGSKRPFHYTRVQNAQKTADPAPAARRKRQSEQYLQQYQIPDLPPGVAGAMNKDGFFMHCIGEIMKEEVKDSWYKKMIDSAGYEYDKAIRDGVLSRAISFKTFKSVKMKLINASFAARPNAQAIWAISVDVNAVFRIGYCATPFEKHLREWIVASCALAKARIPLILVTKRAMDWSRIPSRTEWTNEIENLATQKYPPAVVLHAKMLGLRGEFMEACELLEKEVLPFLKPSPKAPAFFDDIMLSGQLESPWRLYALLQARYDRLHDSPEARKKSDEAIKIAATEFQDPDALVEYASMMMNENNLDLYEEYMSKAATAGNKDACMFLANFYYLTFHGKYPTRGERASQAAETSKPKASSTSAPAKKPSPVWTWITSFFQQAMIRDEYRALAKDWYYLAYQHGNQKASLMMALMAREDGDTVHGLQFLQEAEMEKDKVFAGRLEVWKANWRNKAYVPKLPKNILDVQ